MSVTSVARRRLTAAVLVAAFLAAGAPGTDARAHGQVATQAGSEWFRIIDTIPGDPLAVVAPGRHDVWVALWTPRGLAMAHYDLVQWQVTPVLAGRTVDPWSVRRSGDRPAVLQAVAPDDIWLAAGGGLAHYDGTTWREIEGPLDRQGRALEVTTVAAAPDRVYVGTRESAQSGGHVWRLGDRGWIDLGVPPSRPGLEGFVPREIKLIKGTIMVMFTHAVHENSKDNPGVWWHDGRRWSHLYGFEPFALFSWGHQTAWIVRDDWRHLFFGYRHDKGAFDGRTCGFAHEPGMTRPCGSGPPVSSAVQLKDRSVMLATGSWGDPGGLPRPGPDRLVLRHLDGSEVVVGQASLLTSGVPRAHVTVEPDGMTVWAVTELGLQRFVASSS